MFPSNKARSVAITPAPRNIPRSFTFPRVFAAGLEPIPSPDNIPVPRIKNTTCAASTRPSPIKEAFAMCENCSVFRKVNVRTLAITAPASTNPTVLVSI